MERERLSGEDRRGLMLVASPAVLGAIADLLLWRLAGPIAGAPRTYLGFISWPQTVPAAARELIALGSRPLTTLAELAGWHWRDSSFDVLAWIASILFWLAFTAALTRLNARLLRGCLRIGLTRLAGGVALTLSPWGIVTLPLLHLQWIVLAVTILFLIFVTLLPNR